MRIGIDLRFTAASRMGTGSYSEYCALALANAADSNDYLIGFTHHGPFQGDLARQVVCRQVALAAPTIATELGNRLLWDAAIEDARLDVFFAPTGLAPLVPSCPVVITVHDLLFEQHPEWYSREMLQHLSQEIRRSTRTADEIIAISHVTKSDLIARYGLPDNRIHVVHQGLQSCYNCRPSADHISATLSRLGISTPYFLALSNHSPHKNTEFVVTTFAAWSRGHPDQPHRLILAGGGPAPHAPVDCNHLIAQNHLADRVSVLGTIDQSDLPSLYAGATAFLFPSLAEGWGLPPLEAIAMGAPTIASDCGALPEALASAATILPIDDQAAWVNALHTIVINGISNELRTVMRDHTFKLGKGFSQKLRQVFAQTILRYREQHQISSGEAPLQKTSHAPIVQMPISVPVVESTPPRARTGISGCTIIRNGERLGYPFLESLASYAAMCDELIICWDPTSTDGTKNLVEEASRRYPHTRIIESRWDLENRTGGTELARQTNIAISYCVSPWILYVQADEAVHEGDHHRLLELIHSDAIAIGFERRSFLGTLEQEITEHRVSGLLRLFRAGQGQSIGDAMQVQISGTGKIIPIAGRMFNYSRMGNDTEIHARTANLHGFYHSDAELGMIPTMEHRHLHTQFFSDTHPQPVYNRYKKRPGYQRRNSKTSIGVAIIARESDSWGQRVFCSCLLSLIGHADEVIIINNGLSEGILQSIGTLGLDLDVRIVNGLGHTSFSELRNLALHNISQTIDFIHSVDTDQVYGKQALAAIRERCCQSSTQCVSAAEIHCMIEPHLVQSRIQKPVVFRRTASLLWEGVVHEQPHVDLDGSVTDNRISFLHLGYCRPQWQTLLKWLHYAYLQIGHLDHFRYELVDGVKLPYFRDGRTPDTILESRRPFLQKNAEPIPEAIASWFNEFAVSGVSWKTWVNQHTNDMFWQDWQQRAAANADWATTLEPMLFQYFPHLSLGKNISSEAPRP